MNKAEFAVCRIKEKLPGNQGLLTKGSGCVVHCERLTTSWGWKCHYFIVTPSVVLCREDLSSDKMFIAEFLSKDKRGLEIFELKQMTDVCKDLSGRSFEDDGRAHSLSFLSVEPLDKRGFLKKMVKKGSLQTFRPLDCADSEEESLINEGLFCHVIADLFGESTNSPFTTQTFKLVYESETRQFSLQDFGGTEVKFNQQNPPIGAVIFTKKGEFVGVLDNVDNFNVSPVFLPAEENRLQEDDKRLSSNGVNQSVVPALNEGEHASVQHTNQEIHPGSDAEKNTVDDTTHVNNNAISLNSDQLLPHVGLASTSKSEANGSELGSCDISQQDQDCAANLNPGNKVNETQTEHVLDSTNGALSTNANFEEPENEAGTTTTYGVDVEKPGLFSSSGSGIITQDDHSLVTVIQVGDFQPVEVESLQQTDASNEDMAETGNSQVVPPESDESIAEGELDIEEAVVECSPVVEDGQRIDNTDNSVDSQENLETVDSSACVYTETQPLILVGSMPEDKDSETDSVDKPDRHVAMETTDENSKTGDLALVCENDKDLTDASDGTVNKSQENCEVSIHVTPANEDIGNETEEDYDPNHIQQDVSEDLCQNNSSASEDPLTTEMTQETESDDIGDSEKNVVDSDNKLTETESTQEDSANTSLDLEKVDVEENPDVMYKYLDENIEAQFEQYSPRFDGDEAVVTHKDFVKVADEGIVSAEISKSSDYEQSEVGVETTTETAESPELDEENNTVAKSPELNEESNTMAESPELDEENNTVVESPEINGETLADDSPSEVIQASSNTDALEKSRIHEQESVSEPAADVEKAETGDEKECAESALDDAIVLQRVDADSLLTETVTNNPPILRDLGTCLDTEYQYGSVPCWRDLAELLDIPPEAYEHCGTYSATSSTEDLFVFLTATKPQLTIEDVQEALREIDRHDAASMLDRRIAGGLISKESVVGSLVERDDTDILGRLALKLDRKRKNDWKSLALQLNVPTRVLRNFGSHQRHNSALMLLKYIPIFDPELTLEQLKSCLVSIGRQDAVKVLDNAGIPGDEPVKGILDDSDLLDQITDLLNEDPPSPHWRHLAKELKIPKEKCKIFEPAEDDNSPTKLLFKSIENCEPDLTFEELVLALVAMKRQDVLDVLQKYFSSDDIDQILEENNLLAPFEDNPEEDES